MFLHFFKRSSDNQNPMLSPNGSAHMIDYNNKKVCMLNSHFTLILNIYYD